MNRFLTQAVGIGVEYLIVTVLAITKIRGMIDGINRGRYAVRNCINQNPTDEAWVNEKTL
jgi:hypothetical protein